MDDDNDSGTFGLVSGQDYSTPSQQSQGLVGRLEDVLGDAYSNIKSNAGQTWGDLSNGRIIKAIGDVKDFQNNPFGDNTKMAIHSGNTQPSGEPIFQPSHLNPPNENGVQTLTDSGQNFLNAHSQAVGAQPLPQMQESTGNYNDVSQTPYSGAGSMGSSLGGALLTML